MNMLLIAPHKRSLSLKRFFREERLYNVTTVGSWDAAKKYLGREEDIIVFTPEVANDISREFILLKSISKAKVFYITDFGKENILWQLLLAGIDGYAYQEPRQIDQAIIKLQAGEFVFN